MWGALNKLFLVCLRPLGKCKAVVHDYCGLTVKRFKRFIYTPKKMLSNYGLDLMMQPKCARNTPPLPKLTSAH